MLKFNTFKTRKWAELVGNKTIIVMENLFLQSLVITGGDDGGGESTCHFQLSGVHRLLGNDRVRNRGSDDDDDDDPERTQIKE